MAEILDPAYTKVTVIMETPTEAVTQVFERTIRSSVEFRTSEWGYDVDRVKVEFTPVKDEETGVWMTQLEGLPEPRDEYHTMSELYDYRMIYHAHAASWWLSMGIPVVKSYRHNTGELCFDGEYFIITAELPTGQVSNHYKVEHWSLFRVPSVDLPPKWDGHTPAEARDRLYDFMVQGDSGFKFPVAN